MRALHSFEGRSVTGLLQARARLSHDQPFLLFAPFEGDTRTWTYEQFARDVARVAGGLARRGVERGDRVVVFADNCPESLLTFFACAWLGAVCVPVNAALTAPELTSLVERTSAVGIVTQPSLADTAARAAGAAWIVVSETGDMLLATPPPPAHVDASDPVAILFTSGTTARPKGVVWTHANVLMGAKLSALQEGLCADDRHLVFLPLFHVVALTWSILPTMWAGGSAVLQPKFSASRFWDAALRHRCTWASMVPPCTAMLAHQAVPPSHGFRMWGHAFASPDYEQRFGVPRLLGWWGMTEVITQGIVGDLAFPQAPGTIGRPSVGYDLAVVDDDGRPVETDSPGELRIRGVRGVSLFAEYLDDPQATRDAFDEHGYFRTGDRVRVLRDGTIQFVDRMKDVIRVGGESVAAPEVECVIASVDGVREVAVVARRDAVLGEVPVAFVLADDPNRCSQTLADQVLDACRATLAKFKLPREVVFVDEFPRVSIGKISKAALRHRLEGDR